MLTIHAGNKKEVAPLDRVTVYPSENGVLSICDSLGREYVRRPCKMGSNVSFNVAGSLGNHGVFLLGENGEIVERTTFAVDCHTQIHDSGGRFKKLLHILQWTTSRWGEVGRCVTYEGTIYHFFVRWLRDHVHALKGMKYFPANDIRSAIDFYADTQREDGMIWDNVYERSQHTNFWDVRFTAGDFIRPINNGLWELKRIPVENDVEYLFVEGLYYTWKACGDDAWMASRLDQAIKAMKYSTSDPYRWSKKCKLLKRGFTIDTWDFQAEEDAAVTGDSMGVDPKQTNFGIMHGDNTGFGAACGYVAEMLAHAGRTTEASRFTRLGKEVKDRLDKLAWNGEFYTHHVPEDQNVHRDLGVDQSRQVSLSNAYALNRTLTHEQCVAVIQTYQAIRRRMPKSSPGEFYQIYPPFERGFESGNPKWEYMNGGVTSIVAGELAHGAFEHGFEEYGVDILERMKKWGESHEDYLHCTFRGNMPTAPARSFTTLNLKNAANVDSSGAGAPGVPGWTGEGEQNDLHEMPIGKRTFQGVPFLIADPEKNGRRTCIGLSDRPGYAMERRIPVDGKAASLYLSAPCLHRKRHGGHAHAALCRRLRTPYTDSKQPASRRLVDAERAGGKTRQDTRDIMQSRLAGSEREHR